MLFLSFFKRYKLVFLITSFLFIAPFFWLKPGEMTLGGDDNLLFFYDPTTYLKNSVIYDVATIGKGTINPHYYNFSYVTFLVFIKHLIPSSTIIISIFNGIKLAGGFVGIFLIIYEFTKETDGKKNKTSIAAGIISGIFYTVSLASFNTTIFWAITLTTHNQIFLNPIIFYLIFKFLLTHSYRYLYVALLMSFIYAPNFALTSAPAFFAFYPLTFLFLFFYIKIVKKRPIPWKKVFVGILLFLGIQSFHLVGQVVNLLDKGSTLNTTIFNKEEIEQAGVNYFAAVSGYGKASLNLLLPSENQFLKWLSPLAPSIVIIGFLLNKRKKEFLIISIFFIITFFLVTANITEIWLQFYRKLFYIPGFTMFRNFYTQWIWVFIFFYSLLFGFSLHILFLRLKPLYVKLFCLLFFVILVITGIPLFLGWPVNKSIVRGSNNIKTSFIMDPNYEETLQFIRALPDDGKILVLPLTDFNYQVLYGKNGGAYVGMSTLAHLTRKYSFVGYQDFGWRDNYPYAEDIMKYSREKNYDRLLRIFSTLNIRYILHNSDPKAYEKSFSPGPFGYMQTSLPKTQDEYKDFIHHFPVREFYKKGSYVMYEINKSAYNPTIFIPDGAYQSNQLSFDEDKTHAVFIGGTICSKQEFKSLCMGEYKRPNVDITFNMIDPTLYAITVRQHEKINSMLLVMQHTFHSGWKLVSDEKYIAQNTHIPVNGYANGWFLTKKDIPNKQVYTLLIKSDPQKYFWYGLSISAISSFIIFVLIISPFIKRVVIVLFKR